MASVGNINDLVSDDALAQLDALLQKLGVNTQAMIDATAAANKFNNEIGNTKTLTDFTTASQAAIQAMQGVAQANQTVVESQKQVQAETAKVTEQIKAKIADDAQVTKSTIDYNSSITAAVQRQIELKSELKQNADALKRLAEFSNLGASAQRQLNTETVKLTQRQLELKQQVQQNNTFLNQSIKEAQAASGSYNEMSARLDKLRASFKNLSDAQRNDPAVGGAMQKQIVDLDGQLKKLDDQLGVNTRSVGDYEGAIKRAISQYVPFGRQIVGATDVLKSSTDALGQTKSGIGALGTAFGGFALGGFAVAMAGAIIYLQQFREAGNKITQFLSGFKNQLAGIGSNILSGKNPFTNFSNNFSQGIDTQKQQQDIAYMNQVNDVQIAKMQAQADQYRALAKNVGLSAQQRVEYLKNAQKEEDRILSQQGENAKENIAAALALAQTGVDKLNPMYQRLLSKGDVYSAQLANQLAGDSKITEAGYEALLEAYNRQTAAMQAATMKLIRQQNDEARIESKAAKELNNDELELQRSRLTGAKDAAKLTLDDESKSYAERLAALKKYVADSNALIDTEEEIANRAPKSNSIKRATNAQNAINQKAQVTTFDDQQTMKLQTDMARDYRKLVNEIDEGITSDLQHNLDERLLDIEQHNSHEASLLLAKRQQGKITERQYQQDLKILNDRANEERIKAELDTATAILDIETLLNAAGVGNFTQKQIQGQKDKVTGLTIGLQKAQTQTQSDTSKGDSTDQVAKTKAIEGTIKNAESIAQSGEQILNDIYAQQIQNLETKKTLIDQAAQAEITGINNSILSSKEKAREIAIIDAQATQAKQAIQDKENKIKQQQAAADKALAIAKIIENTAIAAIKAPAELGPLLGLAAVPVVLALGAAQLAAALAAPTPKFAKGGTVKQDGPIITGEAGTELCIDPSGQMSLTKDYANVSYAKAGTKIINNTELTKMLGKPEPVMYIAHVTNDNKKLEKLLTQQLEQSKKQKPPRVIVNVDKFGDYSRRRNY